MKSRIRSSRLAYVLVCGLLVFASLLLGACKNTGAGKRHKLAFVTNNASDFWTIARKGTEKAAGPHPHTGVELLKGKDGEAARPHSAGDSPMRQRSDMAAIWA